MEILIVILIVFLLVSCVVGFLLYRKLEKPLSFLTKQSSKVNSNINVLYNNQNTLKQNVQKIHEGVENFKKKIQKEIDVNDKKINDEIKIYEKEISDIKKEVHKQKIKVSK